MTMRATKQDIQSNWFVAFYKRFNSATPPFFTKIVWVGGIIGSIGVALVAGREVVDLPLWIEDQADNMAFIGTVAAIVAQSTVKKDSGLSQ